MNFRQRLAFRLLGIKESQARILTNIRSVGEPVVTPANFTGFTKDGYQKNAIVFACVDRIAQACSGIELELYQKNGSKKREIEKDPLLDLLHKPNTLQGGAAFRYAAVAYHQLTGNSYIEKNIVGKEIRELWTVRPDMMRIVPNAKGYPAKYRFTFGGQIKDFDVNPIDFSSAICHWKTFHPNNDWYGMSPLEAGLFALDQLNSANKLNLATLQNSATPSGVLQMKATENSPTATMTNEQYERLKEQFYENHVGARNSGRPLILEGGLSWQTIALSMRDMEFLASKEVNALDICRIYGVPGEMIGLGEKTYANYGEARASFYEDKILPLMDSMCDEWNKDIAKTQESGKCFAYDKDDIEALEPSRAKKFTALGAVNYLTQNEKRETCGYEIVEGMDVFVIGSQIVDPLTMNEEPEPGEPQLDEDGNPIEPDPNGDTNAKPGKNPNEDGPQGTRPAKKPVADETDDEEADAKGWKSFGLVNRRERQATWKAQNARRKRLIDPFARDIEHDLLGLSRAVSDAAKGKTDPKLAEFAMIKASAEHMEQVEKTLKRHIKYTLEDFGSMVFNDAKSFFPNLIEKKVNVRFADFEKSYVERRTAKSITDIEGTTKKQVQRIVQNLVAANISNGDGHVDLANDLRDEFDSLSKGRARTIARTEVTMASSNASREAVKSLQIPGIQKEWVSIQGDRTRDGDGPNHGAGANHYDMNGIKVDLDEKFTVPPDTDMDGPGDESAGPDQVCNCRCVLTYSQSRSNEG